MDKMDLHDGSAGGETGNCKVVNTCAVRWVRWAK